MLEIYEETDITKKFGMALMSSIPGIHKKEGYQFYDEMKLGCDMLVYLNPEIFLYPSR